MAITIVGEVGNNCDVPADFNAGSFGTDDAAWEGVGAVGVKASATTVEFYTNTSTELGASAPYDFSSGGTEEGWHIILWSNTKTPVNATTGLTIIVGNGTDRGRWNVIGSAIYSGGWQSRVINPAKDFDTISAGTWTTGGNPAQLSAVSQVGGGFTTTTSIMGSFNNVQIDQFTLGLGLRADAGTVGTPNTFETVKAADEDGTLWGWWGSSNGAYIGRGKLYVGPTNGTSTSVFNDEAVTVIFSNELVASGFYEIAASGTGTDFDLSLASISSASDTARWSLSIDDTTNSFSDTNGVWSGGDTFTLHSGTILTNTTMINGGLLKQHTATLDGCTVLNANTVSGVGFIECDDPESISDCTFEFSAGHALELTTDTAGNSYAFNGNSFTGYDVDETHNSAIYNNSGGAVTLNITGAGTPTVRNGTGASTTVNSSVTLTLTDLIADSEVRIYQAGTTTEEDGSESSTTSFGYTFNASPGFNVDIIIFHLEYLPYSILNFVLPTTNGSIPVAQIFDRNYENP